MNNHSLDEFYQQTVFQENSSLVLIYRFYKGYSPYKQTQKSQNQNAEKKFCVKNNKQKTHPNTVFIPIFPMIRTKIPAIQFYNTRKNTLRKFLKIECPALFATRVLITNIKILMCKFVWQKNPWINSEFEHKIFSMKFWSF